MIKNYSEKIVCVHVLINCTFGSCGQDYFSMKKISPVHMFMVLTMNETCGHAILLNLFSNMSRMSSI